jgi:hypothetical protein
MTKRVFCIVGLAAFVSSPFILTALAATSAEKQMKYAAIIFNDTNSQIVFEGRISRRQFEEWFKTDYPVAGACITIPNDAASFGVLALAAGDEIFVMPLYTWEDGKSAHFACQGRKCGSAPKFAVFENAKKSFLESMKKRLEELK